MNREKIGREKMKANYLIISALLIFAISGVAEASPQITQDNDNTANVHLAYFGSQSCHVCVEIWEMIVEIAKDYPNLEIREYNYWNDREFEEDLMGAYGVPEQNRVYRAVFIGEDYLMGNQMQITENAVRELIEKYSENGTIAPWDLKIMYLAFFKNTYNDESTPLLEIVNNFADEHFGLYVKKFNQSTDRNLLENLYRIYRVPEQDRVTPATVFFGDQYLLGNDISYSNLEEILAENADNLYVAPWVLPGPSGNVDVERLDSWTPFIVAGAGLADGINPCAFATILFFITYLTYLGKRRRVIALTGVSFIIGVFLTYLLIGTGVLIFITQLDSYLTIGKVITLAAAAFSIVVGSISAYDFYLHRIGKSRKTKLKMPGFMNKRKSSTLSTFMKPQFIVPFAIVTGALVSLFELGCTGQVYLPTIAGVIGQSTYQGTAILYLLLYNVMFILPLVILFSLAMFGISSKKLTKTINKNAGTVKLILAITLFTLAALMISTTGIL